jgi:MFS superfamily sulfate permease-like transporter
MPAEHDAAEADLRPRNRAPHQELEDETNWAPLASLTPNIVIPEDELASPIDDVKALWHGYVCSAKETLKEAKAIPAFVTESAHYYKSHPLTFGIELLSGISLSVVMATEGIAFAVLADMPPITGLYACFFMGIIAGAFTGRPPVLSGAAGAIAIVLADLTASSGPLSHLPLSVRREHVLMATFFCGIFELIISALKLARYVRLVPRSTMIGFLNGLAIIIFKSQMPTFKVCVDPADPLFEHCDASYRHWMSLADGHTWMCIINVLLSVAVINFFPKVPKLGRYIPATLVTLLVGSAFEHAIARPAGLGTRTVGQTAPLGGAVPTWHWPSVAGGFAWGPVLQYGFFAAAVGLIESILTAQAVSELMDAPLPDHKINLEALGQSLANLFCGVFGALGGNAMVGESILNYNSGARNRLSTFVCGWMVLIIVVALNPAVNEIPMATIAGVIFGIAIHTFYWPSLLMLHRIRKVDSITIIVVSVTSVFVGLAPAVGIGLGIAALNSVLDSASQLTVTPALLSPEQWTAARARLAAGHLHSLKDTPLCPPGPGGPQACVAASRRRGGAASAVSQSRRPMLSDLEDGDVWASKTGFDTDAALSSSNSRVVSPLSTANALAGRAETDADTDAASAADAADAAAADIELSQVSSRRARASPFATGGDGGDAGRSGGAAATFIATPSQRARARELASRGTHPLAAALQAAQEAGDVTAATAAASAAAAEGPDGLVKVYFISGALFFGSSSLLSDHFTPGLDPARVVIDIGDTLISDYSASSELVRLIGRYIRGRRDRELWLVGVSAATRRQLQRTREFRLQSKVLFGPDGFAFVAQDPAGPDEEVAAVAEAAALASGTVAADTKATVAAGEEEGDDVEAARGSAARGSRASPK